MIVDVAWDADKPSIFTVEDRCSTVEDTSIGGGVVIPSRGVSMKVVGGRTKCYTHISPPGMHPLYYVIVGRKIVFNSYRIPLHHQFPKAKVEQVMDGVVYVFDGTMKKYKGQAIQIPPCPDNPAKRTSKAFLKVLLSAADDVYSTIGRPPVVTSISGGTDGILTAFILKEIGAVQHCVCVGRDEEDFDPKNAREYASSLGLDYSFIPLPSTDGDLSTLLEETLRSIEQSDFSNVLMGMCNVLVRRFGETAGITSYFNADFADVILGNDILTIGQYRKSRVTAGLPVTQESWAEFRVKSGLHSLPTNMQISKVFSKRGDYRQVFYHPDVVDFLLSSPLAFVPAGRDKVLYKAILEDASPRTKWDFYKKIGYYTGSGIGKLRLGNDILSDSNIREVLSSIKENRYGR